MSIMRKIITVTAAVLAGLTLAACTTTPTTAPTTTTTAQLR